MRARTVSGMLAVLLFSSRAAAAADHTGQVTFNGLPVPGATVTAVKDDTRSVTTSDRNGVYRFEGLVEGVWTVRIDMIGFAPISREITVASTSPASESWALTLLPFEAIDAQRPGRAAQDTASVRGPGVSTAAAARPSTSDTPTGPSASRAAAGDRPSTSQAADEGTVPGNAGEPGDPFGAGSGFLINGSVNNGAASLFAQPPAFGNNRPGAGSLYNGGVGVILGNSAWDARPHSFTNQQTPKPSYQDVQIVSTFGGPIKLPRVRTRPIVYFGYQRTSDHAATTQSTLMPTALERNGNFSQSVDANGRAVTPVDPADRRVLPGDVIPADRLSPQAVSLLNYYPMPNARGEQGNYQQPSLVATQQDNAQFRITQTLPGRNQLFGYFGYQRSRTDATNVFRFQDQTHGSILDASANWSHRFSQTLSLRLRYQMTRTTTTATPFFANRVNVSGDAGINGNDQSPANWGPPTVRLSSGFAELATANDAANVSTTHGVSAETIHSVGRHTLTSGGGIAWTPTHLHAQLDPRGTFVFDGGVTGSDLADFLLGIPTATSIAFGNTDTFLHSSAYNLYVNDDLRVSPALTINAGLRWEYEAPATESTGRLSNLALAPDFSSATVTTGTSVLQPDRRGVQPRLGVAWRPVPGSSLVVRGGYGIYRNTAVYQSIATLLAQQPPLLDNGEHRELPRSCPDARQRLLPCRNGAQHVRRRSRLPRRLRTTGRLSAQRDLPGSLSVIGTYLGSKGTHLMQERSCPTPIRTAQWLPARPVPQASCISRPTATRCDTQRRCSCGAGCAMVSRPRCSTRSQRRPTMQRHSAALPWPEPPSHRTGSTRTRSVRRRSSTSGICSPRRCSTRPAPSIAGGALVDGIRGALLKDWTFVVQLTTGSGLPFTPLYLNSTSRHSIVRSAASRCHGRADRGCACRLHLQPGGVLRRRRMDGGERRAQLDRRPRSVHDERGCRAHVPFRCAPEPRLAHRRDERPQPRHLLQREHRRRQPAVRTS